MKTIKRIFPLFIVLVVLFALIPVDAFAVDPVSTSILFNSFAQAITAYGASNGVSLTFDGINSDNTAPIGESVHELWKKYRADNLQADDYETIAAAIFPGLYSRAINAAGNAVVAINIAETYMPDVDGFWNWLLSGPAEMVKVDNAYQWSQDPNNSSIITPTVNEIATINNLKMSVPPVNYAWDYYYNGVKQSHANYIFSVSSSSAPVLSYCRTYSYTDYPNTVRMVYIFYSSASFSLNLYSQHGSNNPENEIINVNTSTNGWYQYATEFAYNREVSNSGSSNIRTSTYPVWYNVNNNNVSTLLGSYDANNTEIDEFGNTVKPYVGDAVAKPVPIPDTSDPDYGPLPYIGNLPLPWNDTLYGDGTDSLTDAQSTAISDAVDKSIAESRDKTMEIEGEQDIPDNPTLPGEVFIPFLPVTLPQFNFSLSGIWHYVREWVSSLGAWFSLVFTVWSYLPYAIVVPVYATAVIIIVLGVYKRFFM